MNALPYSFKKFSTECRSVSVIPMVSIGNWSRKLASLSQPIRCKCNINYDLVACVFPRFRQCGCLNFEFSLVLFLSSDWPISFSFSLRHSIKRRFKSQGKVIDDDTITRQFTWGGAMDDTDDMDDLIEMDWWKIKANQISAFNELCACCATETDPLSLEVVIKWCHFTWQIHSHERLKENLLYKAETFSSRMAIRSEIWAAEKCIIRPQILKMEVKRNVWKIVRRTDIQILETEGKTLTSGGAVEGVLLERDPWFSLSWPSISYSNEREQKNSNKKKTSLILLNFQN